MRADARVAPRALLAAGPAQLAALISSASRGHQGQARAARWAAAAQAVIELHGPADPAVPFADLAAEVATEIRLLRAIEAELEAHAAAREAAYRAVDPGQIARTLPGLVSAITSPRRRIPAGRPRRPRRAGMPRR